MQPRLTNMRPLVGCERVSVMKKRQMNSLAYSLCSYLRSRNNDIAGYWGIGMLCAISKKENKPKFSFKIYPGQLIRIYSCELTGSTIVTNKLVKLDLDSIEGRLSFFEDGRYPHGAAKYTCGIAIAITQGGRTGMSMSHIECWPHDPSRELCRHGVNLTAIAWAQWLKNLLG
jgi:hypothetical protein